MVNLVSLGRFNRSRSCAEIELSAGLDRAAVDGNGGSGMSSRNGVDGDEDREMKSRGHRPAAQLIYDRLLPVDVQVGIADWWCRPPLPRFFSGAIYRKVTYLVGEDEGAGVLQRNLEAAIGTVDGDLDCDGKILELCRPGRLRVIHGRG